MKSVNVLKIDKKSPSKTITISTIIDIAIEVISKTLYFAQRIRKYINIGTEVRVQFPLVD